jgi:hypothetical protein
VKQKSVDLNNVNMIQKSYGYGKIYVEKTSRSKKGGRTKYHWTIQSYEDFQRLYEYLKINPLKTVKMHRIRLSLLYFKYKQLGYHLKPKDTVESKVWSKFCKSWFKYSY